MLIEDEPSERLKVIAAEYQSELDRLRFRCEFLEIEIANIEDELSSRRMSP
jgi:predicted HTH domain antitoxin